MKTRFSTIDIMAVLHDLQQFIGMRVNNVYDIDSKTYLIRLMKPDAKCVLLFESGFRIHSTEFDWPKSMAPSSFSMKLRKHIKQKRLEYIGQVGADRIVEMKFGSGEVACHVFVELYDRGNIVLTDHTLTILNVLRPRTDKDTDVKFVVKETYPIHLCRQWQDQQFTGEALQEIFVSAKVGDNLRKILNPKFQYGPALLDHCLMEAGFRRDCQFGKQFNIPDDLDKLCHALTKAEEIFGQIRHSSSQGYITYKLEKRMADGQDVESYEEFHPFLFVQQNNQVKNHKEFPTFNAAVDDFFSKLETQKLDQKALQQEKVALKKCDNIRKDHEQRLKELKTAQDSDYSKAELILTNSAMVDRAVLVIRSALANQLSWEEIKELVEEAQEQGDPTALAIKKLKLETSQITLALPTSSNFNEVDSDDGEPGNSSVLVDIDLNLNAHQNARKYFDHKKQAAIKEKKTLEASYGSIAPHTVSGRVATIIFAIIGIPIYVIIIHKLGRVFLKLLHKFWKFVLRLTLYCTCASGLGRLRKQSLAGQDSIYNIPVSLAVGVTFAWMLTCAGICCLFFETSWDYFTSFYFFFISLTTIGLGDVTPTHPEYMFTMFGLIIVGLSLVSMCINVVQLKLELLFEEMMLALMEEYQKSGQIVDGEMVSEADLHRGLGFSQLFRLWKKKHTALKSSVISTTSAVPVAAGGLLLPLMAKKRSAAVLRRLQRRSRERTTGTQTDAWTKSVDYRYFPWCEREQATQTNWTIPIESVSPSLVTCSGSISSFPLNRASQDDEEQFHSDISVYSDVGCPHKRSLQHLHYLEQLAGVDESKRPWSSLDSPARTVLAGKTPLPISPLCKADKHTSTPAVSQLDNPWRTRLRRTGILDAVETMPKGILRRPPYDHTVQMPGRLSPHYTSYYYRTSPIAFAEHPQLDHCRYWLAEFQPEAPPGGGVPAMYIRRQANDPACDEFKSLIREIGCRLDECRHIVKQQQEPRRGSVAKQSK